jgi:hypothetical protein
MKLPALDKASQLKYVNTWKAENELYLNKEFGFKDVPQFTFLTLVRTVRKARFERLLKVHRGALVSFMGSGFYGGDMFMVKYL